MVNKLPLPSNRRLFDSSCSVFIRLQVLNPSWQFRFTSSIHGANKVIRTRCTGLQLPIFFPIAKFQFNIENFVEAEKLIEKVHSSSFHILNIWFIFYFVSGDYHPAPYTIVVSFSSIQIKRIQSKREGEERDVEREPHLGL